MTQSVWLWPPVNVAIVPEVETNLAICQRLDETFSQAFCVRHRTPNQLRATATTSVRGSGIVPSYHHLTTIRFVAD